ncbi:MAG: hypothetical protein NT062_26245 [Proteobacteria bacterium]|nr:hypothetical protein [Pseudomonadota bacterium]
MIATSFGCWLQADITLATASSDLVWPLAITGVGLAFLFVTMTTAALSNIPRAELAGAAGVNSFVRQVGGSIGLSVFATLFGRYGLHAAAGLAPSVTVLRPEVAMQLAQSKVGLVARGFTPELAQAMATKALAGRTLLQGTVIGFDKMFILQAIAFIVALPVLVFLRVKRDPAKPVHVEISSE